MLRFISDFRGVSLFNPVSKQQCLTLEMSHGAGWRDSCVSTRRDRR
jgi:hypothetical protein